VSRALLAVAVLSGALLCYVYVGYPLLIRALGAVSGGRRERGEEGPPPLVALVISAYNEERCLEAKLENVRALTYPVDRLQVWVSSDGSTDATVEIARLAASSDGRISVVAHPENRGKTAALMDTLRQLDGQVDVVVFSDANSMYEPDALEHLVAPFHDDRIGVVAGAVTYGSGTSEGIYRRYENWIKRWETTLGSCLCAEGSIFAARRTLIQEVAPTDVEDLAIPLSIALRGFDVVFEPRARSREQFELGLRDQYVRRRRIVNRALRTAAHYPTIFQPWRSGRLSLMFISHRVLRWMSPLAALTAALATFALTVSYAPLPAITTVALLPVGGATVLAVRRHTGSSQILPILAGVVVANAAVIAGVISVLRGRRTISWVPRR
jgi:cellulose synthase/poly-beta-1,6-N-acetylglucosamine synthase-like glycosyltransferase